MSDENFRTEVLASLRDLLKWTRFAGMQRVKDILLVTLDTDQKRKIYHLSNGDNGSVFVAKLAGTSDRTVRRYWELWAKLGIMEQIGVRGGDRYKKMFELEEVGISAPEIAGGIPLENQKTNPVEVVDTRVA